MRGIGGDRTGRPTRLYGRATSANRAICYFVAAGIGLSRAAHGGHPGHALRSYLFDTLGLIAAAGAVAGVVRNDPERRSAWQLFALALVLFAAGDVVYDAVTRGLGHADGYPWADLVYLPAYPVVAVALVGLGRARIGRDTAIDSGVVAFALAAVIWQWVITPTIHTATGATVERFVTVSYPIMDVVLVSVIVLTAFTLPGGCPRRGCCSPVCW